jgi:tetratricopeptide (TPR) repeat protein
LWWAVETPSLDAPIHHRFRSLRELQRTRRPARKIQPFIRPKIFPGRIGHRRLGGEWQPGRPIGRGEITASFHRLKGLDLPPVFVVQAPPGYQKSELIEFIRHTTAKRLARNSEERDAKIDFFSIDPEVEGVLDSLSRQLTAPKSWVRPLRFPRLNRLFRLLADEQRREGIPPRGPGAVEDDRNWLATVGVEVTNQVANVSIPRPPRSARLKRVLRSVGWKISPTPAGRWVRGVARNLPDSSASAIGRRERLDLLKDGLIEAFVEDLRVATRRRLMPVTEIVIYIDGYQRVERSARATLIVELAELLAASNARVMLVVACREQRLWSKLARSQPDYRNFSTIETSARVEIHHLKELPWDARMFSLHRDGVPVALAPELAGRSHGLPVLLDLFGAVFGDGAAASASARKLLDQLPAADAPDQAWFESCSRIVARYMAEDLDESSLKVHLRAAATLRNFDERLLKHILRDNFSGESFERLSESVFVGTPRPSLLLESERTFRARSFVREVLNNDATEKAAVAEWHRRACDYCTSEAEKCADPERAFLLETEALYHRLFIEADFAKPELFRRFEVQLLEQRTDRCETLLRAALDFEKRDTHWLGTCLVHAGKMYVARGLHDRAEERLIEAKGLLSLDEEHPELAIASIVALARCYRMLERFGDARRELRALSGRKLHPLIEFACTWTESLGAKFEGRLATAADRARESRRLLAELLEPGRRKDSAQAAERYGIGALPRKLFHISRHEADIARRGGDYVTALEKIEEARVGYEDDAEDGVLEHNELGRAHLLRQEGHLTESLQLGQLLHAKFTAMPDEDPRGAAEARRCCAHALLCQPDPEQAREILEGLARSDLSVSPRARRFGYFGLGELERLSGDFGRARSLYYLSEEVDDGHPRFESLYGELGRIEIERIERPDRVAGELRQLARQVEVLEHPSMMFYIALIELRAFGLGEGRKDAVRRAATRFKRAASSTDWELQLVTDTVDALRSETEPPQLVFNLP